MNKMLKVCQEIEFRFNKSKKQVLHTVKKIKNLVTAKKQEKIHSFFLSKNKYTY